MSTDRELLELAAKAAGFYFHGFRVGKFGENCYVSTANDSEDWFVWSPLTDDGDALRLAVKLRLEIELWKNGIEVSRDDLPPISIENAERDPYAATRRAIVRAAAAIGALK